MEGLADADYWMHTMRELRIICVTPTIR